MVLAGRGTPSRLAAVPARGWGVEDGDGRTWHTESLSSEGCVGGAARLAEGEAEGGDDWMSGGVDRIDGNITSDEDRWLSGLLVAACGLQLAAAVTRSLCVRSRPCVLLSSARVSFCRAARC
ncbi:hypothetical protein AAFF_G00400850 [Aldrovandia affinis]|uniref:Uncharacterized protein n=1 Tax=Aldrovandia affinis TaxID=143900 RepID=A0AAD7WK73_9TELE|nr:hypothetical protein AAFF_G00400850 [Aldrovandia affinis]